MVLTIQWVVAYFICGPSFVYLRSIRISLMETTNTALEIPPDPAPKTYPKIFACCLILPAKQSFTFSNLSAQKRCWGSTGFETGCKPVLFLRVTFSISFLLAISIIYYPSLSLSLYLSLTLSHKHKVYLSIPFWHVFKRLHKKWKC